MKVERTLAIIKPDAWPQHGGEILTMATKAGLVPVEAKIAFAAKLSTSPTYWHTFYAEHEGKPFFKSLVEFMASGPVLVMVLAGEDAIKRWRALMGPTDSRKAPLDTVRGRFGARYSPLDAEGRVVPDRWLTSADTAWVAVFVEAADAGYPMWRNAVHGSDSPEAAAREIAFFFGGGR